MGRWAWRHVARRQIPAVAAEAAIFLRAGVMPARPKLWPARGRTWPSTISLFLALCQSGVAGKAATQHLSVLTSHQRLSQFARTRETFQPAL